jgi:hypothetical protein
MSPLGIDVPAACFGELIGIGIIGQARFQFFEDKLERAIEVGIERSSNKISRGVELHRLLPVFQLNKRDDRADDERVSNPGRDGGSRGPIHDENT